MAEVLILRTADCIGPLVNIDNHVTALLKSEIDEMRYLALKGLLAEIRELREAVNDGLKHQGGPVG